jgi:hypothetical protein
MANNVVKLVTPQAAQYGGTGPGGGAVAARDAGLARLGNNDADQDAINGGMGYANGQAAAGRPGAVADPTAAANQASGANGNQAGAIELARRQAMGQVPSQGVMQLQQGLNQASQQQAAMAGGARGSAALATAGANQRANTSNLQQNAFGQAGLLRAQDMAAGRGMYGSLTNERRGQDQQALGMSNEFGVANQKAADDYRLGMGNAGVGLGAVGNAQAGADFTNTRNAFDPIYDQDDANQDQQTWLANNRRQAVAANIEDD